MWDSLVSVVRIGDELHRAAGQDLCSASRPSMFRCRRRRVRGIPNGAIVGQYVVQSDAVMILNLIRITVPRGQYVKYFLYHNHHHSHLSLFATDVEARISEARVIVTISE